MKYLTIAALVLALIGGGFGWWQSGVASAATQRADAADAALAVAVQRRKDAVAAQAVADAQTADAVLKAANLTDALLRVQQRDSSNDTCKLPDDLLSDLSRLRGAGSGADLP